MTDLWVGHAGVQFSLVAATGCVILWRATSPGSLVGAVTEDGLVEYATAFGFLGASVAFFLSGLDRFGGLTSARARLWRWGFALLCFLAAGEEVSWGQRVLGLSTPAALQESNVQDELNLHNLDGIHQSIRAVGLLFLVTVFAAIPLAHRLRPRVRELVDRWSFPVFPAWPAGWWVAGVCFMVVPRLFGGQDWMLDEVGELFLAVAFVLYSVSLSSDRTEASPLERLGIT